MGCDIHCYAEKKKEYGSWSKLTGFKSGMYDPNDSYFSAERFLECDQPYDGRNYVLFSLLADVRNGRGFAGCDTGDYITPIDEPRGLPNDVNQEVLAEYKEWEGDAHSASHFYLPELLNYVPEIITKRGYVSLDEFKEYLKRGKPSAWCGGVRGGSTSIISIKEMTDIVRNEKELLGDAHYYTQVQWTENIKEYCSEFFENTIEQLKLKSDKDDFSDIRIVFWFDN